ncbi:hypothetical protein [Cryptosporangium minutisporangium]|uniref:Integral membrane protein n=1 Tax=Cryptosporangium minutisporangium TaxID=113569 RepID=A0ABP6T8X4_9ACTN
MTEASIRSDSEPTHPARPRKATTAAVLLIVFGGLGLLFALLVMSFVNDSADHGQSMAGIAYVLVYAQFALSGTQIVSGVFVWQGRDWARVLAIALCSLNIVGAAVTLISGAVFQALLAVALNVALIRALNDDDVRAWCDR